MYLHLLLERLIRRDMPKVCGSAFGICCINAQAELSLHCLPV